MDWIGVAGLGGTFGFGILSLYQWTALQALRKAIRGHSQATYNMCWNAGNDNHFILDKALAADDKTDLRSIIGASRAADAASVAARHAVITFAREYADFEPFHELAWDREAHPVINRKHMLQRVFSALGGS